MRARYRMDTPQDRLSDAIAAISVLSDLLGSASDIHIVDPDCFALLLSRIARDLDTVLTEISTAPT